MDEGLRVGSMLGLEANVFPYSRDIILLGLNRFEQIEGTVAYFALIMKLSVSKEHWCCGVDAEQVEAILVQLFLLGFAFAAKVEMGLPIGCGLCRQERVEIAEALRFEQ